MFNSLDHLLNHPHTGRTTNLLNQEPITKVNLIRSAFHTRESAHSSGTLIGQTEEG